MKTRSPPRHLRRTPFPRTLLTLLGSLVLLAVVGTAIVAGLRYLELPAAANPARIEQLMSEEFALLGELSLQLAVQEDVVPDIPARFADGSPEDVERLIEQQTEAWRAIEARVGPLDRPEIVGARIRLWRGSTNRIAFVLLDAESDAPNWELPSFETAPEPGRPTVKPVYSGRHRLVRYSAKVGERNGLAYGYDVVFDLERLVALDAAPARPGNGPER